MKRFAFTIILNGLHHLQHNDYYKFMLNNFDYWIIAEGASNNYGSTSWCKPAIAEYHNQGRSVDGTFEFLNNLVKNNSNVKLVTKNGLWLSKDEQVNTAIQELKKYENSGYLWQIDIDEQWTLEDIQKAEKQLKEINLNSAAFPARSWLGKNLLAKGEWGECMNGGYIRLWNWNGEYFKSHEPPTLTIGNGNHKMLPIYFDHYNYYFEKDVEFKDKWYSGHEGILQNWKNLQKLEKENFPKHISSFFNGGWFCNSGTNIIYV